jgi:hypothetical protein
MECERCHQPMIEIDRYGERLIGCLDCNCWRGGRSDFIQDLSVEDIQALRDGRQTRYVRQREAKAES